MGDRTWVYYELRGPIESLETLESICECVVSEGFEDDCGSCFDAPGDVADFLKKGDARFADMGANWGRSEDFEAVLERHGVSYTFHHGNGDGYDKRGGYWSPTGRGEHGGEGATISIGDLRDALNSSDHLVQIDTLLNEAEMADGSHLPPFSIASDVLTALTTSGLTKRTFLVSLSEEIHYQFEIKVGPDDLKGGTTIEQIAEQHFVDFGPQQGWIQSCENRTVDDYEELSNA